LQVGEKFRRALPSLAKQRRVRGILGSRFHAGNFSRATPPMHADSERREFQLREAIADDSGRSTLGTI
jgi:hypothetical protein